MNFFFVDVEIPPKVIMVPFRVPSSLPPSQGVLRLHSQRDCHPYVETRQIQDEKCPQNCTSKCLEIPFRLASSIRQILLIADKTDYQPGETGTVFFESLTSLFLSGAEPGFFPTLDTYFNTLHIVWKLLKMLHLNFGFGIFHQFLSY